jgi:aromatic-amino-acid transaminase
VSAVLADADLRESWKVEVEAMRQRIVTMRSALHRALKIRIPTRNFDYLIHQRGMFSYTGLTPTQVQTLRDEFGIYLVRSGRLCISGLRKGNIGIVADAISHVLEVGQQH